MVNCQLLNWRNGYGNEEVSFIAQNLTLLTSKMGIKSELKGNDNNMSLFMSSKLNFFIHLYSLHIGKLSSLQTSNKGILQKQCRFNAQLLNYSLHNLLNGSVSLRSLF